MVICSINAAEHAGQELRLERLLWQVDRADRALWRPRFWPARCGGGVLVPLRGVPQPSTASCADGPERFGQDQLHPALVRRPPDSEPN